MMGSLFWLNTPLPAITCAKGRPLRYFPDCGSQEGIFVGDVRISLLNSGRTGIQMFTVVWRVIVRAAFSGALPVNGQNDQIVGKI